MSGGVFAVDRGIWEHPVLTEKHSFSKTEAWLWLLSEASWKARRVKAGGVLVSLERGQCAFSIRFLAEAWGWHRSKVERFISALKTETMIETRTETGVTIVSICKYDDYQRVSMPSKTPAETLTETEARQERDKLEDREIQGIQEERFPSGSAVALPEIGSSDSQPKTLDAQVYQLGRRLLGNSAGGLITRLKAACNGDLYLALQVLNETAEKGDPRSWINKRIKTLPDDLVYRGVAGFETTMPRLKTKAERDYAEWEENYYRGVI